MGKWDGKKEAIFPVALFFSWNSGMQGAASHHILLTPRPDTGKSGRSIKIRANFFPIATLPAGSVHHYDVQILPQVPPAKNRYVAFTLVFLLLFSYSNALTLLRFTLMLLLSFQTHLSAVG